MKTVISTIKAGRAGERVAAPSGDDTLGRGMDMTLTLALFIVLGVVLDRWLGTTPVFTIALIAVAAIGSFIRMKYSYFAAMERLEGERLAGRRATVDAATVDATTDVAEDAL